jgi:hypothetical protein
MADFRPDFRKRICACAAPSAPLENTVRYLGIEVDDALEMAEQTEI